MERVEDDHIDLGVLGNDLWIQMLSSQQDKYSQEKTNLMKTS